MTHPDNSRDQRDEPVTFTDKRRVDPQTGEVREGAGGQERNDSGIHPAHGAAPTGAAPGVPLASEQAEKVAELTADLQRVQADFANYRKRALRDQEVVGERAKAAVVSQLLPVLDDLDRARSHGDLDNGPLKSVADKLVAVMTGLGVVAFGVSGEEFDPSLHEAVQHEGEGSNPVIGHVMRQGYRLGDHVLRHALVGVVDAVGGPDTPRDEGLAGSYTAESDQ